MSNPSFSNIDVWLFEYSEGNLNPKQIAQLEAFLLQHPELQVDKDMWDLAYVSSTPAEFPNQERLERKPVGFFWISTAAAVLLMVGGLITYYGYQANHSNNAKSSIASNGLKTGPNNNSSLVESNNFQANQSTQNSNAFQWSNQSHSGKRYSGITNALLGFGRPKSVISANDPFIRFHTNYRLFQNINGRSVSHEQLASNSVTAPINDTQGRNSHSHAGYTDYSFRFDKKGFEEIDLKRPQIESVQNKFNEIFKQSVEIETWKLRRKAAKNSKHTESLSSKLRTIKRKIERMMNNPISLKNLKDPHYHVPGMQAVDINFGATGTLLATRVQTTSRYQWLGNSNDQLSNQVLIDGYVYGIRGGVGLQIHQSNYHNNGFQNTFAALTYSPKFSVTKNVTFEPAIRFKMGNYKIKASAFQVGQLVEVDRQNVEQFYSENEGPKGQSLWYKDVGLSLMVNTKWFFTGIQFDNIAGHSRNVFGSNATQSAPLHTVVTVGTDYQSKNKLLSFSPYLIYQKYGALSEAWLGANFRADWFTVGAGVSSNLEPAGSIGFKLKNAAIVYNIDLTKSSLLEKNVVSHQLSLRFLTNPSRIGKRLLTL